MQFSYAVAGGRRRTEGRGQKEEGGRQKTEVQNKFEALTHTRLRRKERRGENLKWFDRLTILSEVEGQYRNSNYQSHKLAAENLKIQPCEECFTWNHLND